MKLETYEKQRLKKEFENLCKLASYKEMKDVLEIKYKDRLTGKVYNVLQPDPLDRYPEVYMVTYKMPVYIGRGQLKNDWEGTLTITLTRQVFESKAIPNHPFSYNEKPFNQHVGRNYPNGICTGHIWDLAKNCGLWYFIIGIGGILNMEKEWLDEDAGHLNYEAHRFWKEVRKMEPTNQIKWPLDLTWDQESKRQQVPSPPVFNNVKFEKSNRENDKNRTSDKPGDKNPPKPLDVTFGESRQKEPGGLMVIFDDDEAARSPNLNVKFG